MAKMAGCKSLNNIRLAWVRTLSGENTDYRNLQRIEIDSFGWAEDDNLIHLQREFSQNTFSPSAATKIYVPKPSGLLRPITVLRIRDTIIYQAIANVMAEKARRRLSKYCYRSVFSNVLMSKGYPYFYRQWKYGRRKLDSARKQAFNQGLKWIGELDLASFYDVIDHKLLRSVIDEFYGDDEVLEVLFSCLSEWTAHPKGLKHSHGIPQGPLPSSFMAECVLHLLDRRMTKLSDSVYFRYVDDITVMSRNEKDATQLLARIELCCRELGLVPQLKRPIHKPTDIEDLMFPEPSPMQTIPYPAKVSRKQNDLSRKIFLSCFENNRLNKADEQLTTKLNYSLFRMNPDRRILKRVLGLLYTLPSIAEAVNFYLRKYRADSYICNYLFDYIDSEPIYDFTTAQCLVTIYEGCIEGYFSKLSELCRSFLSKKYNPILRSTAAKIIGSRQIYTKISLRMLDNEDDLYMKEHLLFALCNSLDDLSKGNLLNRFIRSSDPHLALTSAYLLTSNNMRLEGLVSNVHHWATPILVNRGLTKRRISGDRVGEILRHRYRLNLPAGFSFRRVFNRSQYKQALRQLNMAEGGFATNRSLWVTQMDNFDQIILIVLYKELGIPVPGGDEFGSLSSRTLKNRFPSVAAAFQKCHELRSSNPVPHAYSRLLGTYSRDIKPRERDDLTADLRSAYQELINKV
jgi:retron-type reverse transcriptase